MSRKVNIMPMAGDGIRLKKAGYATDPDYSEKLISLIERFNLSQLD